MTHAMELADLLEEVRKAICRYVVLNRAQADAITLWVAHTHVIAAFECTPYLQVTSPEPRSGKTRLLEVLEFLVARPWFTGRVTAAALVRKVHEDSPTLLLDESDAAFSGEREYAEALRAILNAGYRREALAYVCVPMGKEWRVRGFRVFCAKAIAGIGRLPDTVEDRSIRIELRRRAPHERVERFRLRKAREELVPLQQAQAQWAQAAAPRLQDAQVDIPTGLDDRAADVWEALLAIADMAGRDWPDRGRSAALALAETKRDAVISPGVSLLRDIRLIFEETSNDFLPSAEIVAGLASMEEAPWGDPQGKRLDTRALARLLQPLGVRPRNTRLANGRVVKAYHRKDFEDSWARYLPAHAPENGRYAATGTTADTGGVDVADASATSYAKLNDRSDPKLCGGVADRWGDVGGGIGYLEDDDTGVV